MIRKKNLILAMLFWLLLVVTISTSSVMALEYTDTEYNFQTWAQDTSSLDTLTNGFVQDAEDDLDGTEGWGKTTDGIVGLSTSNNYEGTNSANISTTAATDGGAYKQFTIPGETFDNCWLAVWLDGSQSADNDGYSYVVVEPYTSFGVGGSGDKIYYVLANSTTFSDEFNNQSRATGFSEDDEDKTITVQGTYQDAAIRLGDCNATGAYYVRNVSSDFYESRNLNLNSDKYTLMMVRFYTKQNYILNVDAMVLSINEGTIEPLPEPQVTGNAKGYYNESGLCMETGSGENAYTRIDFDDFSDKWDYGVKATYRGTSTATNISSSINVDAGGYSDWNHTLAVLGNDTFVYYTVNASYDGENIDGQHVDIDLPASSSIVITSLTIRTGLASGGGGGEGGGGGGVAPETVVSDVVSEITTPLIFGISYAHLLLIGILGVFIGKKYTKKKFTYRVPKQSHLFVSMFGVFILGFSWLSLSVIYLEAPPTEISQLPYEFYLIGLAMPLGMFALARTIKMQNVERPPNKTAFESKDFAPSIVKGIVILTGVSFVLYYMLNFFLGFKADTFLVTNLPTQTTLFAFQLSTATIFFLNVVLPFLEELLFRFVVPQTLAPYMDEFGRAILSAAIFGGFHYYVARILGFAYFIYFFAGGIIFYTVCYGSKWIESRWKRFPQRLRFKGAGIMATFIVHVIFNLMALYSAFLLTEIWVIQV